MSDTTHIPWTCETCGFPIADGTGYVGVPYIETRSDEPRWRSLHTACIDPERDIYGVPVEELRDAPGVLRWTAHLMEKTWAARSTWPLVIRHALTALEVPA